MKKKTTTYTIRFYEWTKICRFIAVVLLKQIIIANNSEIPILTEKRLYVNKSWWINELLIIIELKWKSYGKMFWKIISETPEHSHSEQKQNKPFCEFEKVVSAIFRSARQANLNRTCYRSYSLIENRLIFWGI